MIKLIATIDSERGLCDLNLQGIKDYQMKMLVKSHSEALRHAFANEVDIEGYFNTNRNIYALGGSKLYEQVFPYADQLFITQINGIYDCSTHFPCFEGNFVLIKRSRIHNENGIDYQHQLWLSKALAKSEDVRDTDTR